MSEQPVTQKPDGLTVNESAVLVALYFFTPGLNILIAHVLYKMWLEETPNRAKQVNQLSFAVILFQFFIGFGWLMWKILK